MLCSSFTAGVGSCGSLSARWRSRAMVRKQLRSWPCSVRYAALSGAA